MIARLRRVAWRILGESPHFGKVVTARKLAPEAFNAWSFEFEGHKVNGMHRLTGPDDSHASVRCEHPGCLGSLQELASVDGHLVLLCRSHFTPKGAVTAFLHSKNRQAGRAA